jgi:predicted RNA binding protein YcfA (HicA-like mRNA interferase family)
MYVPKKIRELMRILKRAGFVDRGGKGSHHNFTHPCGTKLTLSGKPSDDAKHYQEKAVERAVQEAKR